MKTTTVSNTYNLKWQIKFDTKYQITECSKIINMNTGRILKETLNGYSKGFWIGKKFIRTSNMNKHVEKIKHIEIPF